MKHTPGPWRARGSDVMMANVVEAGGWGWHVAHVFGDDEQQRTANANLIAAAPAMLKQLRFLRPVIDLMAALGRGEDTWKDSPERKELMKLIAQASSDTEYATGVTP